MGFSGFGWYFLFHIIVHLHFGNNEAQADTNEMLIHFHVNQIINAHLFLDMFKWG